MIDIITHNPFRILGVFANASKKEILSSKGKIVAFNKVGKTVECPSDFSDLLGPIDRSDSSIAKAESQITLAEDRLQASLFWFWDITPVDKIAFNHLRSGDAYKAIEIWSKIDNISSLQNSIVCFLIKGKINIAISIAEILYKNHIDDLKINLGNDQLEINEQTLINKFVHAIALRDKSSLLELYPNIRSDQWKDCVKDELSKPLIEDIKKKISICNSTRGKDPESRLSAGEKLMSSAKTFISQYRYFVDNNTSTDYSLLVDKLAEEILMAAIDYYNKTEDYDSPRKALPLMEYTASIAVGQIQKDRCQKNVETVKEALNDLPPKIIEEDIEYISKLIEQYYNNVKSIEEKSREYLNSVFYDFNHHIESRGWNDGLFKSMDRSYHFDGDNGSKKSQYALELLKAVRPYIISIKSKVQNSETHYVEISTQIVNAALNGIIDNVNEYWVDKKINSLQNASYKERALKIYKEIFRNSWEAILYMNLLDMSQECRINRYKNNRDSLRRILEEIDGFKNPYDATSNSMLKGVAYGIHVPPMFYFPEEEFYNSCKSEADYKDYVTLFPLGKHIGSAKALIELLGKKSKKRNTEQQQYLYKLVEENLGHNSIKKETPKLSKSKKKDNSFQVFFIIALLLLAAMFVALGLNGSQNKNTSSSVSSQSEIGDNFYADTTAEYYEQDNTENSNEYTEIQYNDGDAPFGKGVYQKGSLSTFTIKNPTSSDAVVILVNNRGKWIRNAFVSAGSTYKMKRIPEGKYIIKVMQGHSWNADKDNGYGNPQGGFMQDVAYYQSSWDDPFNFTYEFTKKYISYPTGGVTLESTNGNLEKEDISSHDFFK